MRPELTYELKVKFFAQYYGQWIMSGDQFSHPMWCVEFERPIYRYQCYLLLKPLSTITDEDIIAIVRIITPDLSPLEELEVVEEKLHIVEAISDLNYPIAENTYSPLIYLELYQYLQSKGYALPFMGYSVEELVEAGWVKLQN